MPGGPVQYVQSVQLNGRTARAQLDHRRELHRGGELQIDLGPEPATGATAPDLPSVALAAPAPPYADHARPSTRPITRGST